MNQKKKNNNQETHLAGKQITTRISIIQRKGEKIKLARLSIDNILK